MGDPIHQPQGMSPPPGGVHVYTLGEALAALDTGEESHG